MPIRLSVLHPLMHDCCPSPSEYTSALHASAPRAPVAARSLLWLRAGSGDTPKVEQSAHRARREQGGEQGKPGERRQAQPGRRRSRSRGQAQPRETVRRPAHPARTDCGSAQRSATAGGVPAPPKVCDALDNAVSTVV